MDLQKSGDHCKNGSASECPLSEKQLETSSPHLLNTGHNLHSGPLTCGLLKQRRPPGTPKTDPSPTLQSKMVTQTQLAALWEKQR